MRLKRVVVDGKVGPSQVGPIRPQSGGQVERFVPGSGASRASPPQAIPTLKVRSQIEQTRTLAARLGHREGLFSGVLLLRGGAAGLLTALTDQPLALRRVVPFRVHGQIDTPFVPWATGALKARNARRFLGLKPETDGDTTTES